MKKILSVIHSETHSFRKLIGLYLCYCSISFLFSDPIVVTSRKIPDDVSLRSCTVNAWLNGNNSDTDQLQAFSLKRDSADRLWQIEFSYEGDAQTCRITPEIDGTFYPDAAGTWIITAHPAEQRIDTARLVIDPVNESFLLLKRDENQTIINMVIYNAYFAHDLSLSVPIEKLCIYSIDTIKKMTGTLISWQFIEPAPELYENNRILVSQIRKNIDKLTYAADGAFNELGECVHIADGSPMDVPNGVNCSGFAKWIADGIVYPLIGQGLFINPLKTIALGGDSNDTLFKDTGSPSGYSRRYAPEEDAFFGLYWTRNLAAATASVLCGRNLTPDTAGVDVTELPFGIVLHHQDEVSQMSVNQSVLQSVSVKELMDIDPSNFSFQRSKTIKVNAGLYMKNVGFPVNELYPLMYSLAIDEPDTLYMASVNREQKSGNTVLRKHHHIAVLIPWFDKTGTFVLSVFENAQETVATDFIAKNSDAYIHLVRIHTPRQILFK